MHELHRKMLYGVILKNDFEKQYDKVKWSFIQQTLRKKVFFNKCLAPIHNFVVGGSVAIKINYVLNEIKTITIRRSLITHGIQYSGCQKC
jgi:hypothetical protein